MKENDTLKRQFDPNEVKKSYAKVAWFYDFWGWLTESKAAKKVIELARIENNSRILEVAVGTGLVYKELVKKNPNGQNIGIDLSEAMLKKAKRRMSGFSESHFELLIGNALDLEFEDNSFDILINNFMIDLMPDEDFNPILSEFYRVVKPGGIAVISTFSFGYKRIHKFWHWIAKKFPELLTNCRPINIVTNLQEVGFTIEERILVSQNTFPAEVIKVRK